MLKEKGFFSIEFLIILIIFILTIGIIANLTYSTSEKISSTIEDDSLEKISKEAIDYIISSPDFAIVNNDNKTIKNTVSYSKISKLKDNYELIITNNLFKNKIKSSITIYPVNSNLPILSYGLNEESNNAYQISRLIKCDYFSNFTLIDFKKSVCNQNHDSTYTCNYLKVNYTYIKYTHDLYLVFDENYLEEDIYYSIDDTHKVNKNFTKVTSEKIYLNDIILDNLKNNDSGIIFIHLKEESPNALLIAIPKDFKNEFISYDYFIENTCKIVLKTWY